MSKTQIKSGQILDTTIATADIADGAVTESKLGLSDVTTANADNTKHGFAPKLTVVSGISNLSVLGHGFNATIYQDTALFNDTVPENPGTADAGNEVAAARRDHVHNREKQILNANTTWYVRTDGNDSNDGSSNDSGHAWLTIQHAVDWISANIDANSFTVTVQLGNTGTYTITETVMLKNVFNCQFAYIYGDDTNRANYIVGCAVDNKKVFMSDGNPFQWVLEGIKIKNTGVGTTLQSAYYLHDSLGFMDYVDIEGNFAIPFWVDGSWAGWHGSSVITSCACNRLIEASGDGWVDAVFTNLTFSGTCSASERVFSCGYHGYLVFGVAGTLTGTITGSKYDVTADGFFFSNSTTANTPGSTAGTLSDGGRYVSADEYKFAGYGSRIYTLPPTSTTLPKIVLTENTTWYVRTDGNDSNDGTANDAGHAWLTIQHAIDWISQNVNANVWQPIIQLQAGTYTITEQLYAANIENAWYPTIRGDTANPQNYVIETAANIHMFLSEDTYNFWNIEGVKFKNTAGTPAQSIGTAHDGHLRYEDVIAEGLFYNVFIVDQGVGQIFGDITLINVSGNCLFRVVDAASFYHTIQTMTFSGVCVFDEALLAVGEGSDVSCNLTTVVGSAIGKQYTVADNSTITRYQTTPVYPGTISGTASYGGLFYTEGTTDEDLGRGNMFKSVYDPTTIAGDAFSMDNMVEGTSTKIMTATERTKLAGIETAADVTDATNVDAAGAVMVSDTTVSGMGFIIDEDDMVSDLSTKIPTQHNVKAYVDTSIAGINTSNKFGDGADGDVTISGNTTLTRDMYYNNLTVDGSVTLNPGGFIIYVKGTLVNNGAISVNGGNGGNGATGTGAGGAGGTTAYTYGASLPSAMGGAAGEGTTGAGTANGAAGVALTSTLYQGYVPTWWRSGGGGCGGAAHGVSNGVNNVSLAINSGQRGGNGGAATGSGSSGRRGGGGGAGGGVIVIWANTINNAGTISANGGTGGNGVGPTDLSGNGGGGGGGSVTIYYHATAGSGVGTVTATQGSAGTGGNGGSNGLVGVVDTYQI